MKTYSESRIELRNLQIVKKMLEKSSQVLSSDRPCEPKSFDVALKIEEVKKYHAVNLEAIWFESWMNWKERKLKWRFLSFVVGDSQQQQQCFIGSNTKRYIYMASDKLQ